MARASNTRDLRIGVDVGGTFTKAVAGVVVCRSPIHAHTSVPTTHDAARGACAEGVAITLRWSESAAGPRDGRDVAVRRVLDDAANEHPGSRATWETVGVVGIGYRRELRAAQKRTHIGARPWRPAGSLATEPTPSWTQAAVGLRPLPSRGHSVTPPGRGAAARRREAGRSRSTRPTDEEPLRCQPPARARPARLRGT